MKASEKIKFKRSKSIDLWCDFASFEMIFKKKNCMQLIHKLRE